ncbi:MAG TPA: ABC transporter substrate-binding protein [Chloroflexota bacterium]
MIITERAGLFEKHGLAVKTVDKRRAVGVVQGMMDGELQFGNLASPSMLRMVLQGQADIVFLALGINQQFLATRPGLTERKQLAGARIPLPGDGAITDILALCLAEELAREGIHVNLVPPPSSERDEIPALLSGDVDAAVMTPPAALLARRQGCHLLVDFAEYGLNYTLGGIGASRAYVEAHPDIAQAFVTAYVEGLHRYRTDREFTVSVLQEVGGHSDRSLIEEHYDVTMPGMPKTPYPRTDGLAKALHIIARDVPAAATADPAQFVDDRFVRHLDETGFITRLYSS